MSTPSLAIRISEQTNREWPKEKIEDLIKYWEAGLSTNKISAEMCRKWGPGVTKNAVVGKAHRLDLKPRPSPIKRIAGSQPKPAAPRQPRAPSLPPLPSMVATVVATILGTAPAPAAPDIEVPAVREEAVSSQPHTPPPAPPPQAPAYARPPRECCWPIGEPGRRDFRFCAAPARDGKPYCEEHCDKAFVKVTRKENGPISIVRADETLAYAD